VNFSLASSSELTDWTGAPLNALLPNMGAVNPLLPVVMDEKGESAADRSGIPLKSREARVVGSALKF
jgi:hypothetical protein